MRSAILALALGVLCASAVEAGAAAAPMRAPSRAPALQDDERFEQVALRVTAAEPGGVVLVDRGAVDGLAAGDLVFFYPREGGVWAGNVSTVEERSARVLLRDTSAAIAPGTRGEVRVLKSRLAAAPEPARPEPTEPAPPVPEPGAERPEWERGDDGWTPEMPLLSRVDVLRPETREPRMGGRTYVIADAIGSFDGDRSDTFARAGVDAWMENPFGRGGELEFEVEQNFRSTTVPDDDDDDATRLRVDRLSYALGGTRFAPERHELGRFLQHGMPEFGVLDGYEWSTRLDDGRRFGASAGFMPEPDLDMESGKDFQFAGWYEWTADTSGLSAATGYQKTWHNGAADRDLLVGRMRWLPHPDEKAWDFLGTAWVDFYTDGDAAKDSAVELTQAQLSTSRRWDDGDSLTVSYTHLAFPQIDRQEFLPVTLASLADDQLDRLAVNGWKGLSDDRRLHAGLGGWIDEDEAGGDAELGLEIDDLLADDSRSDGTLFVTLGEFSALYGARVSHGRSVGSGRWDALYEVGLHDIDGFDADNDGLIQQRLRASRDFRTRSGWHVSGYAETRFYDDEGSWLIGVYAQWSF